MSTKSTHDVLFVLLKGSEELILSRIKERKGHFMPSSLLKSQLETLEELTPDEHHVTIDIDCSIDEIVTKIQQALP